MAGTSLLLLIDDIAAVLDDVALMTKIAAKKTAGVLGDDLALNAQQVSGVQAERELPVVWAVAKGSFRNKLILVPAALLISAVAGWLITPLLMLGGLFLCYEGVEKLAHSFLHSAQDDEAEHEILMEQLSDPGLDPLAYESEKIKGAIRTDFILSAEIIVISLGTVAQSNFTTQVLVVAGIAVMMTVGVYGLVAGIVKLDDAGLHLMGKTTGGWRGNVQRWIGARLLAFAPGLMKTLAVVGPAAMFMVGGGILVHGFHSVSELISVAAAQVATVSMIGPFLGAILPTLLGMAVGVVAGALVLSVVLLWGKLRG